MSSAWMPMFSAALLFFSCCSQFRSDERYQLYFQQTICTNRLRYRLSPCANLTNCTGVLVSCVYTLIGCASCRNSTSSSVRYQPPSFAHLIGLHSNLFQDNDLYVFRVFINCKMTVKWQCWSSLSALVFIRSIFVLIFMSSFYCFPTCSACKQSNSFLQKEKSATCIQSPLHNHQPQHIVLQPAWFCTRTFSTCLQLQFPSADDAFLEEEDKNRQTFPHSPHRLPSAALPRVVPAFCRFR